MFEGMKRLGPGTVEFIASWPLSRDAAPPHAVLAKDAAASLMKALLSEVSRAGGRRLLGSTGVLRATCKAATVIPRPAQRVNTRMDATNVERLRALSPRRLRWAARERSQARAAG